MARKKGLTAEQVIAALQKANGLQAAAARALGVSRKTISNYIDGDDEIKAAYQETNESNIDKVEGKLFDQINNGNITAIIFYLKTKAKHRGYVERVENTGADGKPLVPVAAVVNVYLPDNGRDKTE
jgi:hypothetical protein